MSLRARRHAVHAWVSVWPACGFVLGAVLCGNSHAAEVYRCQIQGVTTFVDSPQRCPEGTAQAQGGAAPKAQQPSMPEARRMGGLPGPRSPVAAAVADCQPLAQNPAALRACLLKARRAEVRQIATARLALSRRAVNDYFRGAFAAGDILATSMLGAPVPWCEQVLGDLMAGRNFEVVDDETVGGPEQVWRGSAGRHAVPVLDADFQTWQLGDERVPSGYVTTRWRDKDLVVLRIAAACTEGQDGRARCVSGRYTSISVYGNRAPEGCNVVAYGRSYWPNWKATQTPIFDRGPPAAQ